MSKIKGISILPGMALLLIPIFKPSGFEYYPNINSVFILFKIVSIFFMIVLMAPGMLKLKYKLNIGFLALLFFWALYLINNMRHHLIDRNILSNSVTSIVLINFICFSIKKKGLKPVLNTLSVIFKFWFWMQIISILLTRNGISIFGVLEDDYLYFLGTDNYASFILFPMLGIVIFNNIYSRQIFRLKINDWIYILTYTAVNFYTKSYTALIGCLIVLVLLAIYHLRGKIIWRLDIKKILMLSGFLIVLILVFHVQYLFSNILEEVMKKGLTLSYRTVIWDYALEVIKENLWFGYGTFTTDQINSYILFGTSHAHNIFMELLMRTGIIGLVLYMVFMIWPIRYARNQKSNQCIYILLIFYVGQIVLFIMDFYITIQYFYCFMAVLYSLAEADRIGKKSGERLIR